MARFMENFRVSEKQKKQIEKDLREIESKRESHPSVQVTLKINNTTDIRAYLGELRKDEKVLKISNACKTKTSWLKTLLTPMPRHYYRFLCLTNGQLIVLRANYDNSKKGWRTRQEASCDIQQNQLISAYTVKVKGRNWLLVNYSNLQDKFPVENPDEWVKEITSVIEKSRGQS